MNIQLWLRIARGSSDNYDAPDPPFGWWRKDFETMVAPVVGDEIMLAEDFGSGKVYRRILLADGGLYVELRTMVVDPTTQEELVIKAAASGWWGDRNSRWDTGPEGGLPDPTEWAGWYMPE